MTKPLLKTQATLRKRDGIKRPPLRTAKELADEFGIDIRKFGGLLNRKDAPKGVVRNKSFSTSNTYFEPNEVRRWWKSIKEES